MKTEELYLLWTPASDWGVYNSCFVPDITGVIPNYFYREYKGPKERVRKVFSKLIRVANHRKNCKKPPRVKVNEIIPGLDDLLSKL